MPIFPQIVLILWFPIVLAMFTFLPARSVVIRACVLAMLLLPNGGFALSGFPDYTKSTGTNMALFFGVILFDVTRLLRFRPKWYDLSITAWCGAHFFASITNDLGAYDGFSTTVGMFFLWGVAYLMGRIYLTDLAALKELTRWMIYGGLIYLIPCLIESRLSPMLEMKVYGMASTTFQAPRYGLGYRPVVFLGTGLAVGMWMVAVAMTSYWEWARGAVTKYYRWSAGAVASALLFGSFITKSVGAWLLLALGILVLNTVKRTKSPIPMIILLILPLLYFGLRLPKIWSGDSIVTFAKTYFGEERGESIQTRVVAEDQLSEKALQRPWFGWGGQGRSRILDASGKDLVFTDGYWIIILGTTGVVGLAGMVSMFLLPGALILKRIPPREWGDPEVAPAVALAVFLALYMIDSISNAMPDLVYGLAAGGLMSVSVARSTTSRRRGDELFNHAAQLQAAGHDAEAEQTYLAALSAYAEEAPLDPSPHTLSALAASHEALAFHRPEDVQAHLHEALLTRLQLVTAFPDDPQIRQNLAETYEALARAHKAGGHSAEAAEAWQNACACWEQLVADNPQDPTLRNRLAEVWNDHAWFLATNPDPHRDPENLARAVELASRAVELAPDRETGWNTLGTALFHSGDWEAAINALRTAAARTDGGTAFDHFLLAMSLEKLGDHDAALLSHQEALAWIDSHQPLTSSPDLITLQAQSAALLSLSNESSPA